MDSDEQNEQDIIDILKKPYVKITLSITIIIIITMYLTQSFWINMGMNIIFKEYQAEDILPNNNVPEGIFILSGNYSYISNWINTSKLNCRLDSDVKLLSISTTEPGMTYFRNIVVIDSIEGCK
jgi:hypothetical protein